MYQVITSIDGTNTPLTFSTMSFDIACSVAYRCRLDGWKYVAVVRI